MAIMLPVLVMLFLVAGDFARGFYTYLEVAGAADAGAQYGAQNRIAAADYAGMQNAATLAAADLTGMTATASSFCTCSDGGSTISCTNPGSCLANVNLYVQVNTTATFKTLVPYPGIPSKLTFQGSAILEVK
jgi:Flp pilus assembly protein TadG